MDVRVRVTLQLERKSNPCLLYALSPSAEQDWLRPVISLAEICYMRILYVYIVSACQPFLVRMVTRKISMRIVLYMKSSLDPETT